MDLRHKYKITQIQKYKSSKMSGLVAHCDPVPVSRASDRKWWRGVGLRHCSSQILLFRSLAAHLLLTHITSSSHPAPILFGPIFSIFSPPYCNSSSIVHPYFHCYPSILEFYLSYLVIFKSLFFSLSHVTWPDF